MLKYTDTKEFSAELRRRALPLMSQQEAGFHPVSYAVWYEYSAGNNSALEGAVDAALKEGMPFDEDKVYALYAEFIAKRDAGAVDRMQASLMRVLTELNRQVAAAGMHTSEYNDSLGECGDLLKKGVDAQTLDTLVSSLLGATQRMHASTATLQDELKAETREVDQLRSDLAQARGEAYTDALTGLKNRRGLEQALKALQADGAGADGSCVIMIDIDHFKKCNDTYGHVFGDKVLRIVAQIIVSSVKGQDTAARVGGEEFLILLPGTPLDGAHTLAERIRTEVEKGRIKRIETGETIDNITISLGVAKPRSGETFEACMQRADEALYASKRGGRNRVTVAGNDADTVAPKLTRTGNA